MFYFTGTDSDACCNAETCVQNQRQRGRASAVRVSPEVEQKRGERTKDIEGGKRRETRKTCTTHETFSTVGFA